MTSIVSRRPLLSARGGVIALIASALLCASARADTVHTRYSITLIGLPFGTATVDGTLEPGGYKVDLFTKLTGLASLVSGARGAATATGTMSAGKVRPATYATTSANSDLTRTTRMTMSNGNADQVEITPPWGPYPDRVPITPADQQGIIDPMSALIMPVPGEGDIIGPAACNRTIPVFDGATRFDLEVAFSAMRTVKVKGYSGPVAVCTVRYHPIAGHRANRPGTRFMAETKGIEAWLAPLGQNRIVAPFRISLPTLLGTIAIEATEFEVTPSPRPGDKDRQNKT